MIANYHTHTPRCRHALGTEEEYVLAAIEGGLKILGFSDHTPQWFPGDYYSKVRMYPEELAGYCETVQTLQKQYKDNLQIHLGLEAEYYPACFGELVSHLRDAGIDYMILGQHWLHNEIGERFCGSATEDKTVLIRYCDQVIEAMHTGLFTYVAHPDLVNFAEDEKIYRQHMRRLCREAKNCGIPLEINLLGLRTGRHYPNRLFWEIVAEENCDCILGSDAHTPDSVLNVAAEQKALEMVRDLNLHLIDTVELRSIG